MCYVYFFGHDWFSTRFCLYYIMKIIKHILVHTFLVIFIPSTLWTISLKVLHLKCCMKVTSIKQVKYFNRWLYTTFYSTHWNFTILAHIPNWKPGSNNKVIQNTNPGTCSTAGSKVFLSYFSLTHQYALVGLAMVFQPGVYFSGVNYAFLLLEPVFENHFFF